MHAQVASSFRTVPVDNKSQKGKGIFLVGDAAHRFPPSGGFGMNSGLQDAYNLAWKLARDYHDGEGAGEKLLASYDSERRLVASAPRLCL